MQILHYLDRNIGALSLALYRKHSLTCHVLYHSPPAIIKHIMPKVRVKCTGYERLVNLPEAYNSVEALMNHYAVAQCDVQIKDGVFIVDATKRDDYTNDSRYISHCNSNNSSSDGRYDNLSGGMFLVHGILLRVLFARAVCACCLLHCRCACVVAR